LDRPVNHGADIQIDHCVPSCVERFGPEDRVTYAEFSLGLAMLTFSACSPNE
jgi:hypothetical protein